MLSISLPRIFEDQGSGYPLRVSKVTLKWTGPVKILTMGQLGSSLLVMLSMPWVCTLELQDLSPCLYKALQCRVRVGNFVNYKNKSHQLKWGQITKQEGCALKIPNKFEEPKKTSDPIKLKPSFQCAIKPSPWNVDSNMVTGTGKGTEHIAQDFNILWQQLWQVPGLFWIALRSVLGLIRS